VSSKDGFISQPHLSSATALPWEITEQKNGKFSPKQRNVLWINNH